MNQVAATPNSPPVHVHVHFGTDDAMYTGSPLSYSRSLETRAARPPGSSSSPPALESVNPKTSKPERLLATRISGLCLELLDAEGLRNDDEEDPLDAAREVVRHSPMYRDLRFRRGLEWEVAVSTLGEPFCLLVMLMVRPIHREHFRYITARIQDPVAYGLAVLKNVQLGKAGASIERTLSQIDAVCVIRNKPLRLEKEAIRRRMPRESPPPAEARDSDVPRETPPEKPPTAREIAQQDRQEEEAARRKAAARPAQTGDAPKALGAVVAAVRPPAPPPDPEPDPQAAAKPESSADPAAPPPLEDLMSPVLAEKLRDGLTNEDILSRPETLGTLETLDDGTPLLEAALPNTGPKRRETIRACHRHLRDKLRQFHDTPPGGFAQIAARAGVGTALRLMLVPLVDSLRENGYRIADLPEKPPAPEPEKGKSARAKGKR